MDPFLGGPPWLLGPRLGSRKGAEWSFRSRFRLRTVLGSSSQDVRMGLGPPAWPEGRCRPRRNTWPGIRARAELVPGGLAVLEHHDGAGVAGDPDVAGA